MEKFNSAKKGDEVKGGNEKDKVANLTWRIQADIRPGTINVVRVLAIKRTVRSGEEMYKGFLIGEVPLTVDSTPALFEQSVMMIVKVAARTLNATHDTDVGVVAEGIGGITHVINTAIRSVLERVKGAVIGPDGKRQIRVENDGSILGGDEPPDAEGGTPPPKLQLLKDPPKPPEPPEPPE